MLSKNKIKYIHSLGMKKIRDRDGVFVAEGPKVVGDLLEEGWTARCIVATEDWPGVRDSLPAQAEVIEASDEELRHASFLQHPQQVLGIFSKPDEQDEETSAFKSQTSNFKPQTSSLSLALDDIQDPGNLGTIIRIADWFGITHIYCSKGTADVYSPKVIQSTMGSIARVSVSYVDLQELITSAPKDFPIYATSLDGQNIYHTPLTANGLIIMGNEGRGISPDIIRLVSRRLLIPSHSAGKTAPDSLNVAVATAIVCAEFKRRSCNSADSITI